MLKRLIKFFKGPTPEEAFENGKKCVDSMLAEGAEQGRPAHLVAEHIYHMGFGMFNESESEKAFDRGMRARLNELDFSDPY